MNWKNLTFCLLISIVITLLLNACSTVPVKPCASIQTDDTTWELGVTVGRSDYSCSDGLDNDLLRPDIYTNVRTF